MSVLKDVAVRRALSATIRLTVPTGWGGPICSTGWPSPRAVPFEPNGILQRLQRQDLMAFCKDFNARTQKYKPDTPMAVKITAYKDNTFEFTVKSPSVSWYLKKAAGIEQGSSRPGHVVASSVTLKHVYEIAKVKQTDPGSQHLSLEAISKSIIGTAKTMGIEVVKEL